MKSLKVILTIVFTCVALLCVATYELLPLWNLYASHRSQKLVDDYNTYAAAQGAFADEWNTLRKSWKTALPAENALALDRCRTDLAPIDNISFSSEEQPMAKAIHDYKVIAMDMIARRQSQIAAGAEDSDALVSEMDSLNAARRRTVDEFTKLKAK